MPKRKYLSETKPLTNNQYKKIMHNVAKNNWQQWGDNSEEDAYTRIMQDKDYDYKGYYSKYPNSKANASTHWTDEFKGASHPTFSDESVYSGKYDPIFNPNAFTGGHWIGKGKHALFISPKWNPNAIFEINKGIKKANKLDKQKAINILYSIENPRNRNISIIQNTASMYNDGYAPTIGAGVADRSGAPSNWFSGRKINKTDVDNFVYNFLSKGDSVIKKAYDDKYGTLLYPHPSDTLSFVPRMYAAQNRYQRGSLGGGVKGRNAILEAMANGSSENLIQAVKKYTSPGDKDRIRRITEAMPIIYE